MLKILVLVLLLLVTGCSDEASQSERIADLQSDNRQNLVEQHNTNKLLELEKYAFSSIDIDASLQRISESPNCSMVLQFVATHQDGINLVKSHIDRFTSDNRLESLPICINQPVWFETSEMSCSTNADERLKCDISPLIKLADKRNFTHAVVVGKSGKANVHNGIMYLDYNDRYSVFVHELAHFAGFVDEYPLSTELANDICKPQAHPNITVFVPSIKRSNDLTAVRTCDNHINQSFKLVQEMTFMEYHDVGIIPQQYLEIWKQRLQSVGQLTPAYVNFAQYYEALGDATNAEKWWQDYQQYL